MTAISQVLFPSESDDSVHAVLDDRLGRLAAGCGTAFAGSASAIRTSIIDGIGAVLAADVGDLLVPAWATHRSVRRALRTTRAQPGTSERVTIFEHELDVTHEALVELEAMAVRQRLLRVVLNVDARVAGVVLLIEGGQIVERSPGSADVEAALLVRAPNAKRSYELARHAVPGIHLDGALRSRDLTRSTTSSVAYSAAS